MGAVEDTNDREEIKALARRYHGEMIAERGMDMEAQILEVIREFRDSGRPLAVKGIASCLSDQHGEEYERNITTRWVGSVIRRKLQLRPIRVSSGYVIPPEEFPKVERLYERYGIAVQNGDDSPAVNVDRAGQRP